VLFAEAYPLQKFNNASIQFVTGSFFVDAQWTPHDVAD
jgi:hypothetical protein